MGDRNNPIKFGPEWLRNMSRERSAGRSTNNSLGASGGGAAGPSQGPAPSTSTASTANNTNNDRNKPPAPRVLLAGLRYGREEMLALYDGNAEAPAELKGIENLYQHRGKQPIALNNTFDEDLRDNLRSAPPIGGMASSDRFGIGRGPGRGGLTSEGRGRGRGSYTHRQMTSGRGGSWVSSNPRMPGFSGGGGPSEEGASARPWTANNVNRNSGDQTDWAAKMFRNKRPGTSTNWRQPTREEGEEWRSSDTGRNRQSDKWGNNEWNNWGERPTGDRPPSWHNRRPWGGDSQNEENLPEWVAENADCGGSFDSSGAFHGYSNDDTNIPKPQETTNPLTRSHTHGSFPRPKHVEEGSDEWWASEKAKKLSPKRFDASDIKFKKQTSINVAAGEGTSSQNSGSKTNSLSEESAPPSTPDKLEPEQTTPELPEATLTNEMFTNKNFKSRFNETNKFDKLTKNEEASGERGNFQSVLIPPNNSLRQKHQYLVPPDTEEAQQKMMEGYFIMSTSKYNELEALGAEDLVEDIFGMSMEEKEILRSAKARNMASLEGMSSGLGSVLNHNPKCMTQNLNAQMNMPNLQNHDNLNMEGPSTSAMHPEVSASGIQANVMPYNLSSAGMLPSPRVPVGLPSPRIPVGLPNPGMMPGSRNQAPMPIENAGVTNSALNASLGLPIGPGPNMGMPMQGIPPPMHNMGNAGHMGASGMIPGMPPFGSNNGMNNLANSSLFLGPNPNNQTHPPPNEMQGPPNMFPMHGQHNQSQPPFPGNNMYMNTPPPMLADQWYYEDPDRNIQGPFSSKDMYNWYRAGFFTPSLMVRRSCEAMMRPLGTYGPVVPFAQPMDMLSAFPLTGGFESRSQDSVINSQSSGLDMTNINKINMPEHAPPPPPPPPMMENIQFGSVGLMANQFLSQPQQGVDNLWGQPSTSNDMVWMQHPPRGEARVNNLPIYFWDQQPSAIASNALLPEEIAKEMKTEDEILAQLRASQNIPTPNFPFINEKSASSTSIKPDDCFAAAINATPNLEELHKLIQKEALANQGSQAVAEPDNFDAQLKQEKQLRSDSSSENVQKPAPAKPADKPKAKENDKSAKNKENNNTKNKNKKNKEDKKDEEVKTKEEEVINAEKRSQEPSPSKNKKDDKTNKKELEREKKEWIKEGFTIVKGAEKTTKDNKKKVEEARAADEAERKRKEEEKLAAEEEKKRKQAESAKKQQEQQQRQAAESVTKKAPWSVSTQSLPTREPTLAEIQRLEREKKLEQMKEQQQMMQIIAQQQAAALAREQEVQAGLGWAKKKGNGNSTPGQSMAEIQAETRKQAAAAAAAAAAATAAAATAAALEEARAPPPQTTVPWGNNTQNGGLTYGFWDTQPSQPIKEKAPEPPKPAEPKAKKKPVAAAVTVAAAAAVSVTAAAAVTPAKKDTSPAAEFETWCTTVLAPWSSKIDVPTFVGFLKDIESPYEVKDYVKCYLGETKDSGDFSRQFLERRSKLLRVGMVTPSDDLCSPAMAVTPRGAVSDLELKNKGKKTKKNRMLKVDARILGFSVTAAEDRINVGDIDTA